MNNVVEIPWPEALCDRSRRPVRYANQLPGHVESLIVSLKRDAELFEVPVLAVTAYAGKGDEERIRDSGAEGYLSKPVSIGPFMAAVKGLLETAA